jgi:hypothetical protein
MIIVSVIGKSLLFLVVVQLVIHTLLQFHYLLSICCCCMNQWWLTGWATAHCVCVCVCACTCAWNICVKTVLILLCYLWISVANIVLILKRFPWIYSLVGDIFVVVCACVVNPVILFVLSLDCVLSRERLAQCSCTHIAPKCMRNRQ